MKADETGQPIRDWTVHIRTADSLGFLTISSQASRGGGIDLVMRTPHGPMIPLELEDMARAAVFFERVHRLITEDVHMRRERNSTLHAVRGVARQLIEMLDAGDVDTVRATLESYALPKDEDS